MRNSVISVLATLCAGSAFVSTGASGQQPTAMSLMMAMMACPALAADGETIAIFSLDPAGSEDARNSLAIFTLMAYCSDDCLSCLRPWMKRRPRKALAK